MGERSRIMRDKRRKRLYALVAAAGLTLFGVLIVGLNVIGTNLGLNVLGASGEPVQRVATPNASESAIEELARPAADSRPQAPDSRPQVAIPTDTTMYLTIPKLGLYDIPVLEGISEAVLSQGVGHVPGTGYPWAPGSNVYIGGHRLGYPGTISDHVFWELPSMAIGDEVIVEDSLGQTYTYRVSEILEVPPNDLSVMEPTGRDIVSLQTCIENYGDYWTAGPNWFVRYVVRADKVG
jgi:sortase A